jgi:hypothetical protein
VRLYLRFGCRSLCVPPSYVLPLLTGLSVEPDYTLWKTGYVNGSYCAYLWKLLVVLTSRWLLPCLADDGKTCSLPVVPRPPPTA